MSITNEVLENGDVKQTTSNLRANGEGMIIIRIIKAEQYPKMVEAKEAKLTTDTASLEELKMLLAESQSKIKAEPIKPI